MALLSKKPLADNGLKHNVFKPYRHPCFSTFQCVIVGVIVAIIIGSVVAVLDHLWPQPPKFEITSLSISPFDILEFRLTADWNISFHIENTNKRSLRYKDVKVSVYYQNELCLRQTRILFISQRSPLLNMQCTLLLHPCLFRTTLQAASWETGGMELWLSDSNFMGLQS